MPPIEDNEPHLTSIGPRLLKELSEIRRAIAGLGATPSQVSTISETAQSRPSLTVTFRETSTGDRLPFEIEVSGVLGYSSRLTDVRLVIAAVLFKDLQDRLSGGPGLTSTKDTIAHFASALSLSVSRNAIKSALYRFDTEFVDKFSGASDAFGLSYVSSLPALEVINRRTGKKVTDMAVDVMSPTPRLDELLQSILPASPLARARARKVLYVPGGPTGFDRLFLELFDHPYQMVEESLFFKPSIITYPDTLLNFMQASEQDQNRRKLALEAMRSGRCRFREILRRTTLQDMITFRELGRFELYHPTVIQRHVEDHLAEMIRLVKEYQGYCLTLTSAPLPFLLSLFEIHSSAPSECYTIFFRQLIQEHDPDVSCFVINDPAILDAVRTHIIQWVQNTVGTVDDRIAVVEELEQVLRRLKEQGPIWHEIKR